MRKLSLILLVSLPAITGISAQTGVKGVVKIAGSEEPLQGVQITLMQQNISSLTNADGEFFLSYIQPGDEEISLTLKGYFTQIKLISLKQDVVNDLGVVYLVADTHQEMKQEVVLQLSESALDGDDSRSQNI
ncbi:MAG: carboxypeptidase-like regulatory domain-containing protein, partial [Paludibacter sp.]